MDIVEKLMKTPKKDKGLEQPHIPKNFPKDYKQQLDLIFLPNDNGDRYALVAVDVGTRLCDAEPISNKKSTTIIKALQTIYKRKILNQPDMLYIDAGNEFKGEFLKYLRDNDILYRVSKIGRHRQTSLVENKNKYIGKA